MGSIGRYQRLDQKLTFLREFFFRLDFQTLGRTEIERFLFPKNQSGKSPEIIGIVKLFDRRRAAVVDRFCNQGVANAFGLSQHFFGLGIPFGFLHQKMLSHQHSVGFENLVGLVLIDSNRRGIGIRAIVGQIYLLKLAL